MIAAIVKVKRKGLVRKRIKQTDRKEKKVIEKHLTLLQVDRGLASQKVKKKRKYKHTLRRAYHRPIVNKSAPLKDKLNIYVIHQNRIRVDWEISPWKVQLVSIYFDNPFSNYIQVIRMYDVTGIDFDGSNTHFMEEFELEKGQDSLTINGLELNHLYCLEVGIKLNGNRFFPLSRSNNVQICGKTSSSDDILTEEIRSTPSVPQRWQKIVSTYSYYENMKDGWELP